MGESMYYFYQDQIGLTCARPRVGPVCTSLNSDYPCPSMHDDLDANYFISCVILVDVRREI